MKWRGVSYEWDLEVEDCASSATSSAVVSPPSRSGCERPAERCDHLCAAFPRRRQNLRKKCKAVTHPIVSGDCRRHSGGLEAAPVLSPLVAQGVIFSRQHQGRGSPDRSSVTAGEA